MVHRMFDREAGGPTREDETHFTTDLRKVQVVYSYGRLIVGAILAWGLLLPILFPGSREQTGVLWNSLFWLRAGLVSLTIIPVMGLALAAVSWLHKRASDSMGWLALFMVFVLLAFWLY